MGTEQDRSYGAILYGHTCACEWLLWLKIRLKIYLCDIHNLNSWVCNFYKYLVLNLRMGKTGTFRNKNIWVDFKPLGGISGELHGAPVLYISTKEEFSERQSDR